VLEKDGVRDADGGRDALAIWMADDDATDDLAEDKAEEEATDTGLDESNGVLSDAGGSPVQVLASRLQTGQKVLHDVSHESTHNA